MPGKSSVLLSVLLGGLLLLAAPSQAQDEPEGWYAAAVAAGEIRDAPYRKRVKEILDDVNAARQELAGVNAVEWDVAGSEGHFRHARWLLHHMKEPWNSGGVTDFHDEAPSSELFHLEGRAAAKTSLIAFKYLFKRREPFHPTDRWLPTVVKRFPLLLRSAKTVHVGYAEGVVPKGADFAGEKWGVVVLATDGSRTSGEAADDEPVVCPRDGAKDVPLELLRELPDIVPAELDGKQGEKTDLGFPLTFSFFGGQALLPGAEVTLVRIEEVEIEEEEERLPPGSRRKKKKKKKPKFETVETEVECYVSTPLDAPLLEKPVTNQNSVVVIPLAPLATEATYRATLKCRVGTGDEPKEVELVTTFATRAEEKE